MIETGRYKGIPLEERLCQICDDKCIEDEQHFIGSCKSLSHIRASYKERFMEEGVDIEKLDVEAIKIMLDADRTKLTCDLLQDLFEERKILMYDITENETDEPTQEMHVGDPITSTE